jgi:hypothetical protein
MDLTLEEIVGTPVGRPFEDHLKLHSTTKRLRSV